MHSQTANRTVRLIVTALIVSVGVSGCETVSNWLKGRRTFEATDPVILGAPEANSYLSELYELVTGDPATQAEIFADAEAAARITPDTSSRLRYSLILGTPGHAEEDGAEAQGILRELLSQQELMTSAEVALATLYLREIETRIVLNAEARRLRSETDQAASTEDAAVARRLTTIEADNRRLRQSLAEAESKLEAITTIERSIRETNDEDDSQ